MGWFSKQWKSIKKDVGQVIGHTIKTVGGSKLTDKIVSSIPTPTKKSITNKGVIGPSIKSAAAVAYRESQSTNQKFDLMKWLKANKILTFAVGAVGVLFYVFKSRKGKNLF